MHERFFYYLKAIFTHSIQFRFTYSYDLRGEGVYLLMGIYWRWEKMPTLKAMPEGLVEWVPEIFPLWYANIFLKIYC